MRVADFCRENLLDYYEMVEALKADYEERMKAMAAEYEAKIAEIQNQKDGKGDDK